MTEPAPTPTTGNPRDALECDAAALIDLAGSAFDAAHAHVRPAVVRARFEIAFREHLDALLLEHGRLVRVLPTAADLRELAAARALLQQLGAERGNLGQLAARVPGVREHLKSWGLLS